MSDKIEKIKLELGNALRQGAREEAQEFAKEALDAGMEPLEIIENILVPTLMMVGEDFQSMKLFLPELMATGEAAKAVTTVVEDAMASAGQDSISPGTVVLGTVKDDVHDIGKNIVNTMLSAYGFKVIDVGIDVPASKFVETARNENADIIALSALMTTTRPATASTIDRFVQEGERDKYNIIIGGGCIDQKYADEIGADGYAADAAGAVELCKRIMDAT